MSCGRGFPLQCDNQCVNGFQLRLFVHGSSLAALAHDHDPVAGDDGYPDVAIGVEYKSVRQRAMTQIRRSEDLLAAQIAIRADGIAKYPLTQSLDAVEVLTARMDLDLVGQVQTIRHDSSLPLVDENDVAVRRRVERVIPAVTPRHHGYPNSIACINPSCVHRSKRFALKLFQHDAHASRRLNPENLVVLQTGHDECAVAIPGVAIG